MWWSQWTPSYASKAEMTSDSQANAIGETLTWLEQQIRQVRDEQARSTGYLDQLRRQVQEFAADVIAAERAVREIDPKLQPLKNIPDKLTSLDRGAEEIRQAITSHRAELDNAMRILRSESDYDREERAETAKRIESSAHQLGAIMADIAQVQSQAAQISQTFQTLLERQREVEARVEQFGLRLERSIEVNRDLEQRIHQVVTDDQEERFAVVFERLQVVGEMVKRNEDLIAGVASERSMREELLHEISIWRDQHSRIDSRINALEEAADKLTGIVDRLGGEITLLEGRHSGLGERVAGIRRDIAEVVDHVRDEFAKYNQMMEKQRRKQIQVLEQELREMKFHAFKPPEEP
jgi:chromosome segregation ATPase